MRGSRRPAVRRQSRLLTVPAVLVALLLLPPAPALAAPAAPAGIPAATAGGPAAAAVSAADRDTVLGPGWRAAGDRVVLGTGDSAGFHLLAAEAADGYAWRTVASLSEPGLETDAWIGNVCVTGSGRSAVVVYAPRTFTNKTDLFDRGGFTAVVDLRTGGVRKLPVTTSVAYFNPGCGAGEQAVLRAPTRTWAGPGCCG
jgi:hypothetical protein